VSARDAMSVAFLDLARAKYCLSIAHEGLHEMQTKLNGTGVHVKAVDQAVAELSEAIERVRGVDRALWDAFVDEEIAKCA